MLNEILSRYVLRPVLGLSLISLSGCGDNYFEKDSKRHPYEFDNVGYAGQINSEGTDDSIVSVATGDIDGDGDLDLIVGTKSGRLFILENQMPQKKPASTKLESD